MAGCRRHGDLSRSARLHVARSNSPERATLAGSACLARSVTPFAACIPPAVAPLRHAACGSKRRALARSGDRCAPGQGARAPTSLRQCPLASAPLAPGSVTPLAAALQPSLRSQAARPRRPDAACAGGMPGAGAPDGERSPAAARERAAFGRVVMAPLLSARPSRLPLSLRFRFAGKSRARRVGQRRIQVAAAPQLPDIWRLVVPALHNQNYVLRPSGT